MHVRLATLRELARDQEIKQMMVEKLQHEDGGWWLRAAGIQ